MFEFLNLTACTCLADALPSSEVLSEQSMLSLGPKIVVLLSLLIECTGYGDKVLVFSQSRPTLDFIEIVLQSSNWDEMITGLGNHSTTLPVYVPCYAGTMYCRVRQYLYLHQYSYERPIFYLLFAAGDSTVTDEMAVDNLFNRPSTKSRFSRFY